MNDTRPCTVCGRPLAPLDQYGPPQAPLCLEHWHQWQDGELAMWPPSGTVTRQGFDGYGYRSAAELKEKP